MNRRGLAAALRGFVLLALAPSALFGGSISGRLVDSLGRPVAGARVVWTGSLDDDEALVLETEGRFPEPLGETRSDANGAFRVPLEKAGLEVALRIESAGLPSVRLAGPYASNENASLDEVRFPATAKRRGRVVDEKGAGVTGARVEERLERPGGVAAFVGEARTAADGSWEMAAAPEGARVAVVRAAGFVSSTRILFRREGVEATALRRGREIRGAVLDGSGKPAADAIVSSGEVAARTDAAGAFRLTGIGSGAARLVARRGDFAARASATVGKGGGALVTLRLARAPAVAGTVVDETTRRPVAGARIALRTESGFDSGPPARRARADTRGRFRAAGVLPGRYTVEAASDGYLPAELTGVVAALPDGKPLAIALRREASIAGIVLDEEGKPVAGARVVAPREPSFRRGMRRIFRSAFDTRETATGADGRYALRGLSAESSLTVEASKAGFAPGRRTGLRVKTGEAVAGITLVLRRGLAASGRVVDREGRGIAAVEIRANRVERGRGFGRFYRGALAREAADTVTDAAGDFALAGLEEGRYAIAAAKDGFAPKVPADVQIVRKGENRIAPILLDAGAALSGFVRSKEGEPVVGAEIFVATEGSPFQAVTDGTGAFRVAGLAPGRRVSLFVSAVGFGTRQASATPPASDLAIALDRNGTVRGRVVEADTKAPVADFSIYRTEPRAGGGFGMRMAVGDDPHAFHAEDGSFALDGVPAGKWTIHASSPGYRTAEVGGVEVSAGGSAEGIVISLARGGTLAGRVVDAAPGTAVANASVSWAPASGASGIAAFGPAPEGRDATSDADGKFAFDGLPDGKVVLSVSHPDYMDASVDVDPAKQSSIDVGLSAGGAISGTVVASDGHTPAAGARVTLDALGETGRFGTETAAADGAGGFVFDHLRAGRYELVAQSNAGSSAPSDLVLADGQRADGIVLSVAGGTLLQGTVSGLAPEQLAGVRVVASSSGYSDVTTTDDSGHFTLPDVPAGVVRLNAATSFRRERTTQTTVEVPDGAPEMPVDIVFEGTSTLAGRVTRAGRALSGLIVVSSPESGGGGRSLTQTDGDGHYTIEGLLDGAYRVSVSGEGVSYATSFDVSGDTAGDIEVPGATVSGRVTDAASGMPLDGAEVAAESGAETQTVAVKRTATDSNGAYTISDVDPGAYQVTARRTGYRLETQPVTVGTDGASLDFALAKGSGLAIRVADGQTGIPLAGVQVLAFSAGGTVAFQGRVPLDGGGAGEIPSLADGRYAIALFSDGYAARNLPAVDVPSPEVAVAMTPGGRVEVRAVSPVTGHLMDALGNVALVSPWRLDGSVSAAPPVTVWEHLAPGAYRFLAALPDGPKAFDFQVTEGQTTPLAVK